MSPREVGVMGRVYGLQMYRPWRSMLQVGLEASHFPQMRGTTELTRRLFIVGFREGWAVAEAAHAEQAKKE